MQRYLFAVLLILSSSMVRAAEPPVIVVELTDGRVVEGQIDEATDDTYLWLRRSTNGIVLATSYPWSSVAGGRTKSGSYTPGELKRGASDLKADWPREFLIQPTEPENQEIVEMPPPAAAGRTASVHFSAELANWDYDAEPDGYLLRVSVLDDSGQPMVVRGTLRAKLVGDREHRRLHYRAGTELDRWTERIDARDFASGCATYKLRFHNLRPEHDVDVLPDALLHIEVGVFGAGRFEATQPVPVRYFNPVRDRLQLGTGSRLLRDE